MAIFFVVKHPSKSPKDPHSTNYDKDINRRPEQARVIQAPFAVLLWVFTPLP